MDNETSLEQRFNIPIKFNKPIRGERPKCIQLLERNGFALADSAREKALGIITDGFYKKSINRNTMEQSKYRNLSHAILLSSFNKSGPLLANNTTVLKSDFRRFVEAFIKPEDISQSYYHIKMRSFTIPDLYLKMDFLGTIKCSYTKKNFIDLGIDTDNSNHKALNVGNNFIELLRTDDRGDVDFDFHVKFNDMQNIQSFRLFMLAALITLCITQIIKSIVKIVEASIIYKKEKRKNDDLFTFDNNGTNSLKDNQHKTGDDIPGFYL